MSIVNNLYEFMEERGFNEVSIADIERNTYKYTSCGAWFCYTTVEEKIDHNIDLCSHPELNPNAEITVGSIVEGSDAECTPNTLLFPFKMEEFWQGLEYLENEASELWSEHNNKIEEEV